MGGRQDFFGAVSSELAHFLRPRILEYLRYPEPTSNPAMCLFDRPGQYLDVSKWPPGSRIELGDYNRGE